MLAEDDAGPVIEGWVSLTWHVQRDSAVLPGALLCIRLRDDPSVFVSTVTRTVITSDASGLTVADLTMFADQDGRPIFSGMPLFKDGEIRQGTFRFYVTSFWTCHHDGAIKIREGTCNALDPRRHKSLNEIRGDLGMTLVQILADPVGTPGADGAN